MGKTTVYYFASKGTGEAIRLLLAYGGQEFEDRRIEMSDWADLKPKMPFQKMPVIEIDGKMYSDSIVIASYLGHKYGLAGKTLEEDLEINQNILFFNDFLADAGKIFYEKDEDVKKRKHDECLKNEYPFLFCKLEEIITTNNGHMAAGKLTWADFVFAGSFNYMKYILDLPELEHELEYEFPSYQKVIDAVYDEPKVKAYVESRPKFESEY